MAATKPMDRAAQLAAEAEMARLGSGRYVSDRRRRLARKIAFHLKAERRQDSRAPIGGVALKEKRLS